MRRLLPPTLLFLLLGAICVPSALADPAFYGGSSSNGEVAVFSTAEQLQNTGDTDQEPDVFVRALDATLGEPVTREVSIGPKGGNDTRPASYDATSADGTKVFFSTKEPLVSEDTDDEVDVYMRDLVNKKTILVSQGDSSCSSTGCGNGNLPAGFAQGGVSADGDVVFFTSSEILNSDDGDGSQDLYARSLSAHKTILVSAGDSSCTVGTCGNGAEGASYKGIDKEGDRAVFTTTESLSSEDLDVSSDVYVRDLGAETTTLVSVSDTCPSAPCTPSYGGISADGSHVFFETSENLSAEDLDSAQDVYDWSGSGMPALVSIGPNGGNGTQGARYKTASDDGKAVYFVTVESLLTADADGAGEDVYRRFEGTTTLISEGEGGLGDESVPASLDWVSPDSSVDRAIFTTAEPLVPEDTDSGRDVYERSGGSTVLISTGPEAAGGNSDASFSAASVDASKIFFVTPERVVPQDTDDSFDVYRRSAGSTIRVSVGQINGNKESAAVLQGISSNGTKAFFTTSERLTEGDIDSEQDVYVWREAEPTLLISTGNGVALGPPPPSLDGTTPTSPNASTTPTIFGSATAGAQIKIYKSTGCTGPVIAQGTATQLASPGFSVTVVAGSTTYFSATAESEGLTSLCSSPLAYKQEDAQPPTPPDEGGSGDTSGDTGGGGSTGSGATAGSTTGTKTGSGGTPGGGKGGKEGISYATPLPHITFGPASKTRLRRPTFRFLDATGQPGTRFFCRVDKQRWAACSSPIKLKKLHLGRHSFSVKAVNAVGTAGASPVKRAFKVVPR
ncbi:MAG TPA: hypothetical protein VFJ61_08925 [Solirubrobacterales bacterium]|nr:hypothetical protein [Solirubrobacterales bacterium]